MINKEQLKEIIKELIGFCEAEGLNISDEKLLEEACQYHRGFIIQENKKKNMENFKGKVIPITEAQEKFIKLNEKNLRRMGYDIDNIQSKADAFKVISEYKKRGENGERKKQV